MTKLQNNKILEWEKRGASFYATNISELICIHPSLLNFKTYEIYIDAKFINEIASLDVAKLLAEQEHQKLIK